MSHDGEVPVTSGSGVARELCHTEIIWCLVRPCVHPHTSPIQSICLSEHPGWGLQAFLTCMLPRSHSSDDSGKVFLFLLQDVDNASTRTHCHCVVSHTYTFTLSPHLNTAKVSNTSTLPRYHFPHILAIFQHIHAKV